MAIPAGWLIRLIRISRGCLRPAVKKNRKMNNFGEGRQKIAVRKKTCRMEFEAVENPSFASSSGAGVHSAQLVTKNAATAVLTGSCGSNASQTFRAAGVEVVTGVRGKVKQAVRQHRSSQFLAAVQPSVLSHFGLGGGGAEGPGLGMRRGLRRGMGRGRGVGRGMGFGPAPGPSGGAPDIPASTSSSAEEEIRYLKEQAEFIKRQLKEIPKRVQAQERARK